MAATRHAHMRLDPSAATAVDARWPTTADAAYAYESDALFRARGQHSSDSFSPLPPPDEAIAGMWEDFEVDAYYPGRPVTQPGERAVKKTEPNDLWQWPHATKPQPFAVAGKVAHRDTPGARAYEEEKRERERLELAECRPAHSATPAPGSTWQPRFAELDAKERARRQRYLATRRHLETQASHAHDARVRASERTDGPRPETRQFRARPAPKAMLASDAYQRLLEEDSYRAARRHVRAAAKLREARAPGAHEQRLQAVALGWRHGRPPPQESNAGATRAPKRRGVTRPQPFRLTEPTPEAEKVARVLEDMRLDDERARARSWGGAVPQRPATATAAASSLTHQQRAYLALGSAAGRRDPPTTRAARLRAEHAHKKLHQAADNELRLEEEERQRQQRQKALAEAVHRKSATRPKPQEQREAEDRLRVKAYKFQQEAVEQRYRAQLYDMEDRLASRSCLFDRWPQEQRQRGRPRPGRSRHAPEMARALGRYHRYTDDEFASVVDDLYDEHDRLVAAGQGESQEADALAAYLSDIVSLSEGNGSMLGSTDGDDSRLTVSSEAWSGDSLLLDPDHDATGEEDWQEGDTYDADSTSADHYDYRSDYPPGEHGGRDGRESHNTRNAYATTITTGVHTGAAADAVNTASNAATGGVAGVQPRWTRSPATATSSPLKARWINDPRVKTRTTVPPAAETVVEDASEAWPRQEPVWRAAAPLQSPSARRFVVRTDVQRGDGVLSPDTSLESVASANLAVDVSLTYDDEDDQRGNY